MKDKIKIAMVLSTGGLDYDDRIRREMLSIQKLYPYVSFKVFAMLPDNKSVEGVSSYGIPYKSVYIKARDKYARASHTLIKGYQFYKAVKNDLRSYDVVWTADVETAFVTLLANKKRLVWDLHELPSGFMGKWWMRIALKYMFTRCKVVIHANPQRKDYLQSIGLVSQPEKHFALRNFSDIEKSSEEQDDAFKRFLAWKGNKKCVYLQGLNGDSRAPYESISAILKTPGLYALVIGRFDDNALLKLEKEYSNLKDRVFFTGLILQQKIPLYVEQCYMSLVFYKNVSPNNWLCDSNRFYQSVLSGKPVVAGNNPSMKGLIEQYKLGVSVDDDGSDVEKMAAGIKDVMDKYDVYSDNIKRNKKYFLWDNQEDIVKNFMDKLLKI